MKVTGKTCSEGRIQSDSVGFEPRASAVSSLCTRGATKKKSKGLQAFKEQRFLHTSKVSTQKKTKKHKRSTSKCKNVLSCVPVSAVISSSDL